MSQFGKPSFFDVETALQAVQQFVNADEIVTALEILDKFPAYYRDFPTKSMVDLRKYIFEKLITVEEYCLGERDHVSWGDQLYNEYKAFARMQDVADTIKQINSTNRNVFIYEFGPGHFWLPYGLMKDNLKFKYKPLIIEKRNADIYEKELAPVLGEAPEFTDIVIFVAFEVLEHLFHEKDILHFYHKYHIDADFIFISTPKYTLGGGRDRRDTGMLAHIRTYTPSELVTLVNKFWPGRNITFNDSAQMWVKSSRVHI